MYPVSFVDAASVVYRWAVRKSAGYFDPSILLLCNETDFIGHFGEVLILTQYEHDIAFLLMDRSNHVQSDPNIDTLFLAYQEGVTLSVRQIDRLIPVTQVSGKNTNALSSHRGQFG